MAKPTPQQCHALITHYIARYEEVVGSKPSLNRNKARWGFESILMDHSAEESRSIIDYFLDHYEPNIDWFLWNYEKVVEAREEYVKNQDAINHRREETQKRLDAWRERMGKNE